MIDCIIQRHQADPSEEHIIPKAIGGKLTTWKVCTKCNNDYCSKLDVALTDDRVMLMARHQYKIPGYDVGNRVFGTGTMEDGTVVNLNFDQNRGIFVPDVRGGKTKTEKGDGTADIAWTLPPGSNPEDLVDAARKELAKHGEIGLTDGEVLARMTFQDKAVERPSVTIGFKIDLLALTLAGLKIAYEFTADTIGYEYLKDPVADQARDLILAGIPKTEAARNAFSCSLGSLTFAGNTAHTSQHKLILARQDKQLLVVMSLFDTFIGRYEMSAQADIYAPFQARIHQIDVVTGDRIDHVLP